MIGARSSWGDCSLSSATMTIDTRLSLGRSGNDRVAVGIVKDDATFVVKG
jgi:hypothetical protein